MNVRVFLACIFLTIFPYSLSVSADDWTEYSTPHFKLYTNVSTAMAEDWVTTLETFTRLLPAPRQRDKPREFKVIVLSDYGLFQNIKPHQSSSGFTQYKDSINLIVGRGITPFSPQQHKEIVFTLFNSSYVNSSMEGYPYWFINGIRHVFSSAKISGNQATIQNYIREGITRAPEPFALSELMFETPGYSSITYNMNSYAYVHYLLFGSVSGYPDYRDKLAQYLSSDNQTLETFEHAMGKSLAGIQEDFEKYKRDTELKAVAITLVEEKQNIHQRKLSNDESNYMMALLLHQFNQYDYAQKYVKKISKASPQYIELHQQYQTYKAQEKALKAAEKTLKKEPDNLELLTMSVNAYWEQAKVVPTITERNSLLGLVIDRAQRVLVIDPDVKEMHALLRFAYNSTGQREKSFHHIKEYLRLEPENADINFVVGRRYLLEKDYGKARIYLNKACELDSEQCARTARELKEIEKIEAEKTISL